MIRLCQAFCDYCSTIEGESELSRNKHRITYTNHTSWRYHHICTFTLADPDHIHACTDIEVTVKITHREVTQGHITDAPTEAHHATDIQVLIITNGTHHIGGLPHIEAPLHILETAVGLDHVLCTKLVKQHLLNLHTALTRQHGNTRIRNIKRSPLITPHLITTVLMTHPVIQRRI